jgi:ATP-dependent DNA helicase RecQ
MFCTGFVMCGHPLQDVVSSWHLSDSSHLNPTQILHSTFGYTSFRHGQEEIVTTLMAGKHILAVMPTGAGKSLCFQVPALALGGLAVVVSPLVALMQDQVQALKLAGVAAETINSSQSRDENVDIWRRVAAGEVRLLYMAPERLMTERMLSALQKLPVSLIAIDEAHCISQWGASFRPEYDELQGLRRAFPKVPIGAFTATADEATRHDIVSKLFGGRAEVYVAGFDRPNIRLTVESRNNATKQLLNFLDGRKGESGIVYSLSRKSTEEWAAELKRNGYNAVAYHAGLSPERRAANQDTFMTESGVIVCATVAFGMGIDKPDVRFVFHADLPATMDAYYQEIGRAGRDGEPADAHMVFGIGDIQMRRRFIEDENAGEERKRRELRRLDALVAYCETTSCRRQSLLTYFGETFEPCGNCDMCLDPGATVEGDAEAKLVLRAVQATGQRFGSAHLADVLRGDVTDKVQAQNHQHTDVFGAGKAIPRMQWMAIVRQMIGGGLLKLDAAGHGGIAVADKGLALFEGQGNFRYRLTSAKAKRAKSAVTASAAMDDATEDLLQRLKTLRFKLARQRNVPAYVIFSDRTLIDMAQKKPVTKWDFGEVHGVGDAKLEQFSSIFLAEIAAYLQKQAA